MGGTAILFVPMYGADFFISGGRKMFEKVSTDLNFVQREVEIEKFWRDNEIFKKSVDQREGCDVYMFYEDKTTPAWSKIQAGPPSGD